MKKLHPNALWLFFVQYMIAGISFFFFTVFCLGFTALGIAVENNFAVEALGIVIFVFLSAMIFTTLLAYVWARLSYNNYFYELRDEGFYKEYGVITKKYVTIPYERIQNIDIYRGIFARLLGLSDLQIQTAGMSSMYTRSGAAGGGSEGRLPGLSEADAKEVRDQLVKRAKGNTHTGGL